MLRENYLLWMLLCCVQRTLKKQQAISKRTGRKIRTPLCPCCREPQPNIVLEDGKLKMGQALKKLLGDDPLGDPGTCNDATALVGAGEYYSGGIFGFTKNQDMAIKFWHRAAEGYFTTIGSCILKEAVSEWYVRRVSTTSLVSS